MIPDNPRSIARIFAFILLAIVLANLFPACAALGLARADGGSELIVRFQPGAAMPPGARAVYGLPDTYVLPARTGKLEQDADDYAKRADVVYAHPNYRIQLDTPGLSGPDGVILSTVNDPYAPQQYSLDRMGVYDAWSVSRGDGVLVAAVDSGAAYEHPDLRGKMAPGRDFVNNDNDPSDDAGHGTHVAGIIGAATNNGQGVAGVGYNARVLPVKVMGSDGRGYHDTIASGIIWAADQGARIINLSIGGPDGSPTLEAAINYAWAHGALPVCAAGNGNTSTPAYPAYYANCLSVGATDQTDRRAGYSNYGAWVDIGAPGSAVLSTVRSGVYQAWDGTSMAAPNAAGVAALVWAAHPTWTNAQVRDALIGNTDPIAGAPFGGGLVNAARAVGAVAPAPQPTTPPTNPTQSPPGYGGCTGQTQECELFALINAYRKANGLTVLLWSPALTDASRTHNRTMRDTGCFAHTCPDEKEPVERMKAAGFVLQGWGGENIGMGYQSPQAMFDGWKASSGHNAFMLNTLISHAGIGYLEGSGWSKWWTFDGAKGYDLFAPSTPTPLPWPGPATPRPMPSPTSANGLPRGWRMYVLLPQATAYVLYDYDTSSFALVDAVYRQVCVGLASQGARCEWRRK